MLNIKFEFKDHMGRADKGMTLMELIVAMGISAVLITAIVAFISSIAMQYSKQKEAGQNIFKALYITQAFNTVDQWPEVRVKGDNKALKITDNTVSPAKEIVYYELKGSIYKDQFENGILKNTMLIAQNFTINFSFESDASYSKDILKIVMTDMYGQDWTRKISLRDCEVVETY